MSRIVVRTGEHRRRPNPFLAFYRWRYELAVVAGVVGLVRLGQVTHWVAPLGLVLTFVAVVVTWPAAQGAVARRCRSVVAQHRLRSAFRELCLTTWAGRTPAILWTAPCREGLRVRLFCPAGIALRDFTPDVRARLAGACDAREVRVDPKPQHTALVTLLVITRAPVDEK